MAIALLLINRMHMDQESRKMGKIAIFLFSVPRQILSAWNLAHDRSYANNGTKAGVTSDWARGGNRDKAKVAFSTWCI